MHEHVFVSDIMREAAKHGDVKSVVVEVGDLAKIPAEDLETTLKSQSGWDVQIVKKPGEVECVCGYTGEPNIDEKGHDFTIYHCPECREVPSVVDGDQIILKDVTVD